MRPYTSTLAVAAKAAAETALAMPERSVIFHCFTPKKVKIKNRYG